MKMATQKTDIVKRDCFAIKDNLVLKGGEIVTETECTALEHMECRHGNCKFYKPKYVYLLELQRFNGTFNIDEVVQRYALERQKRGEVG